MVKKARSIPVKQLIASFTFFCLTGLLPALAAADSKILRGTIPILTLPGIRTIIPQENGKVLIGGPFDQYDGAIRYVVGRLNGQTPTSFSSLPNGTAELGNPFQYAFQAA